MTSRPHGDRSPGATLLLGLAGLLVVAVAAAALVLAPAPQGAGAAAGGPVSTTASTAVSTTGGPSTMSYGRAPEVRGVERTGDAPLWWSLAGVSGLVLVTGRMLRLAIRREP